jgi:hypothetical protein
MMVDKMNCNRIRTVICCFADCNSEGAKEMSGNMVPIITNRPLLSQVASSRVEPGLWYALGTGQENDRSIQCLSNREACSCQMSK